MNEVAYGTVLVADDDELFRRSVTRVLGEHGYACLETAPGAAAVAHLDADPDIAVMLSGMPARGAAGLGDLRAVIADFPDVAVIVVTGVDDPTLAESAFAFGAFGYLVKPVATGELLVALAGAHRRRELERRQQRTGRTLERTLSRNRTLDRFLDEFGSGPPEAFVSESESVERLSRALSLRDEETGQHIERMSRYAAVLADAVGYTELSAEEIRLVTALHDVGKIGVPDVLLLKPGPLTDAERTEVQRHAHIGFQLLGQSRSSLLGVAAEVALAHHEWWDGSGYPRGLRGEEIHPLARIAAVTDVFDALTSNRVYRARLSFDDALSRMRELRGRQFEPRLLDAFVGSLDRIRAIRETHEDADPHKRIRVLVVDDHEIFAHSLVRLLEGAPDVSVVGTVGTVSAAVEATIDYEPDVVLMDFELPDGDGAEATDRIKALMPGVKVIMLTGRAEESVLLTAIAAGCSGFVRKHQTVDRLIDAIVAAHENESMASGSEVAHLLGELRPTRRRLGADLSPREIEILQLMASGMANDRIGDELGLRSGTVRNHVEKILAKLQAHSNLEAAATGVRERIIDRPPLVVD